jgi:hypothetical protein
MEKYLKSKWVETLRSGNYRPGAKRLRNSADQFCCLGVLCDIIDNTEWRSDPDTPHYLHGANAVSLNSATLKDYGLSNLQQHILMNMNDKGASFPEISNYIEKSL